VCPNGWRSKGSPIDARIETMLIILLLYVVLVWLVFSKFKLVRWGWLSGSVTVLVGALILAVFMALLNSLAPTGRITVTSRVVEVTPNVTGEIVAIPVKTNVPVKAGTVLFQIDPAPFRFKVAQLEAALVSAEQNAKVLKANYEQQSANVAGLTAQVHYHQKRLSDLEAALRRRKISCRRRWRRSTAPSSRSIPKSAASIHRCCRPRRNSKARNGN
jgi:multidrug resistance efflux pump